MQISRHAVNLYGMDHPACIRLPFLRPQGQHAPFARYLSPGNAVAAEEAWQPDNFPMSPSEAANFLASLQTMSLAELETMRLAARRDVISDQIAEAEETAAIARFRGQIISEGAFARARLLAQRLLLWRWFWEECQAEIAKLAAACAKAEQNLPSHFREKSDARADPLAPAWTETEPDIFWRPVAANASFFLPAQTAILAEGEMAASLQEELSFQPAGPEFGPTTNLRLARAPLWRALGHSRPASGCAAPVYNQERRWLIWSEK